MKRLNSFLILLMPLAIYYDFPFTTINISTTLSFLFLVNSLVIPKERNVKTNKYLIGILLYFVASTIAVFFLGHSIPFIHFIFVAINIIIYVFLTGNVHDIIDVKFFFGNYKRICFILISFFAIQHLISILTGRILFGLNPFLPISDSYKGVGFGLSNKTYPYYYSIRLMSSLFSEPSHFAVYLLPLFVISLCERERINWFLFGVTSFTILLTLSGNGILASVVLLISFLLLNKKLSITKRIGSLIGVGLILLLVFLILNNISVFNGLFSNLFIGGLNRGSKADYRVFRGFYIFGTMPSLNKLVGLGFNQLTNYLSTNNIATPFDYATSNVEYANFVAQFMIYFGFIGLALLILFAISLFRKSNYYSRTFFITTIALWFSTSMMFDSVWVFLLTFVVVFNSIEWRVCYGIENKQRVIIANRNKINPVGNTSLLY